VAADLGVVVPELLAGGDPEHLADQVETGDLLRDAVLDLQAGVDLEERDGAVLTHQELAGAGTDVPRLEQDRLRRVVKALHLVGGEERRGRLLDQLLVASLERAVAGGDDHDVAVGVGQALGLDVPWAVEELLHEALAAAERRDRLAHGRVVGLGDLGHLPRDLEAAAAAAESRLDRDRQAELLGERDGLVGVVQRIRGAGGQRSAHLLGDVTRPHLVAEALDGRRGRADPHQPGVEDGLGEGGVLGQEAVAGVDRVGTRRLGDGDDLGDVEVGVGRGRAVEAVGLVGQTDEQGVAVGLGVHRDAADPGIPAGADHANGDLAPVGDQDLLQGSHVGQGALLGLVELRRAHYRQPTGAVLAREVAAAAWRPWLHERHGSSR
jgi:hypothetical protein